MKFLDVKLYRLAKTGETDELGNKLEQAELIKTVDGAFSPWTSKELDLLGRTLTQTNQKIFVKGEWEKVSQVEVNGKLYDVTKVIHLSPRWTYYAVKALRVGK